MNKKNWLNQEVGKWAERGIVSPEQAQKIRAIYANSSAPQNIAAVLFSVLGAVCLGLGVILVFAYNWDQFSRVERTLAAFAPLVVSGCLGFWVLSRRSQSLAWNESIGALFFLSIGATLALVSQTYHLNDDFNSFLLIWMLSGLPVIYFFNAGFPLVAYLAGITFWIGDCQNQGGHALFYWPLFMAVFPKVREVFHQQGEGLRKIWAGWAIAVTQTIALGVSLEKSIPGFWMVIYAFYFAALEWVGRRFFTGAGGGFWSNPLNRFGRLGILGLAYLLTFHWPWRETGILFYRDGGRFHGWAAVGDYVLFALLGYWALSSWVENMRARRVELTLLGLFPLLIAFIFALNGLRAGLIMPELVFNLVLLGYGVCCTLEGWKTRSLAWVNGGLAVIAAILVTRFGDEHWGILTRAFIFIILGAGFLMLNRALNCRKEKV